MKELLLASAAEFLVFVLVTTTLRVRRVTRRAACFLLIFLLVLPGLFVAYAITPRDLGFLPEGWIADSAGAGLLFCLLLYFAGFFGGILQLYNLADRGLSLRILIDLHEAAGRPLTPHELAKVYGSGKGLAWMYNKRLAGLSDRGLIEVEPEGPRVSSKGRRAARLFGLLRRVFGIRDAVDRSG